MPGHECDRDGGQAAQERGGPARAGPGSPGCAPARRGGPSASQADGATQRAPAGDQRLEASSRGRGWRASAARPGRARAPAAASGAASPTSDGQDGRRHGPSARDAATATVHEGSRRIDAVGGDGFRCEARAMMARRLALRRSAVRVSQPGGPRPGLRGSRSRRRSRGAMSTSPRKRPASEADRRRRRRRPPDRRRRRSSSGAAPVGTLYPPKPVTDQGARDQRAVRHRLRDRRRDLHRGRGR